MIQLAFPFLTARQADNLTHISSNFYMYCNMSITRENGKYYYMFTIIASFETFFQRIDVSMTRNQSSAMQWITNDPNEKAHSAGTPCTTGKDIVSPRGNCRRSNRFQVFHV